MLWICIAYRKYFTLFIFFDNSLIVPIDLLSHSERCESVIDIVDICRVLMVMSRNRWRVIERKKKERKRMKLSKTVIIDKSHCILTSPIFDLLA